MKAVICKNMRKNDDLSREKIAAVEKKLRELGFEAAALEPSDSLDSLNSAYTDCDLIVTVGGDGTILHHGKIAAKLGKPLLGINTGRLGFMTSVEFDELDKLKRLDIKDEKHICSRMMLDVEIGGQKQTALNDVVFGRGQGSKLPDFQVEARGIAISEIRGDGLIVSTPTGSTAYALSAGGPIIEPWLDCVEIIPLCAHSLLSRPMILSGENPVTVRYNAPDSGSDSDNETEVFVCVDGEAGLKLKKGENAVISKSALRLSLVTLDGGGFYGAVVNKLMKPLK